MMNIAYYKDTPIIAIDGPSGAGKGTISRLLAQRLNWHYLDSGSIYRILALVVIRNQIFIDDIPSIVKAAGNLDVSFVTQPDLSSKILLAGEDITRTIRKEECGIVASKISSIAEVRSMLIDYQRSFLKPPGLVADGRDMGTVVFPDAKIKVFLTATVEERAQRRLLQLQDQGINANLSTILAELVARDKRDYERAVSPLKIADDAVVVDTTKLSIDEVLYQIMAHVENIHVARESR